MISAVVRLQHRNCGDYGADEQTGESTNDGEQDRALMQEALLAVVRMLTRSPRTSASRCGRN